MKKTIFAEKAPATVGPYVHAVEVGNMVFTSGQLGLDPENGTLPEGIEAQTHQALKIWELFWKQQALDMKTLFVPWYFWIIWMTLQRLMPSTQNTSRSLHRLVPVWKLQDFRRAV